MLDQLSEKLQAILKDLRGYGKLSEANIAEACRSIRLALLEADVNFQVAKDLVEKIRTRALGKDVVDSVTPGQQMVKVFRDELAAFLGEPAPLATGSPLRIVLCGLQGSGKTTTAGKLANWLKRNGRQPLLVAADLQRPAAITQLQSLGAQIDVPVFTLPGEKDPIRVVDQAESFASGQLRNAIIYDTAGRLDLDEALLDELRRVHATVRPQETLFVADAALGQKSVDIVTRFHQTVPLTGLILTRLDGDARGGAALSMRHVTGVSIKFLGTGEKIDQIEALDPVRLAGRILGMGDVVALVEKAQDAFDRTQLERIEERLRKNQLDLEDFLAQLRQMKRLGPLENILALLPGMPKELDFSRAEKQLKQSEAIILSMTPLERRKPELLNARRRQRIARGSGTTLTAVNNLLEQFGGMRKMLKNKGKMKRMLAGFGLKA